MRSKSSYRIRCPAAPMEMRRARLSLEEIFLQLTTAEEPTGEDDDFGDRDSGDEGLHETDRGHGERR